MEKVRFLRPIDMLKYIQEGNDLYNPETGEYIFVYNEEGSICNYHVSLEEMTNLYELACENNEYIGAYLGTGGEIYDDPTHEYYNGFNVSNYEYCCWKYIVGVGDWYSLTYEKGDKILW